VYRTAFTAADLVQDERPQIAFVGRSNVGKSSLLNRLLRRKGLARTSSTPGRTRSINFFLIDERFFFVDLPGYGYAKVAKGERSKWAKLIDAYFERALPRTLVVLLVDAKVGPTPLDQQAYAYFRERRVDPVVVATKIDRVPRGKRSAAMKQLKVVLGNPEEMEPIPFSASTGEGSQDLWDVLNRHVKAGRTA